MDDPAGGAEALANRQPDRGILLSCGHWTEYGDIAGVWPGFDTKCLDPFHGAHGTSVRVLATNITKMDAHNLYRNRIDPQLYDGRIGDQAGQGVPTGAYPRCVLHGENCDGYHTYQAHVPARTIPEDLPARLRARDSTDHGTQQLMNDAAKAIEILRANGDELAVALHAALEREAHPAMQVSMKFDTYIASAEALDAISGAIARLNAVFTMESGVDIDLSGGIPIEYEGTLIGRLVKVGHVIALDVRQG